MENLKNEIEIAVSEAQFISKRGDLLMPARILKEKFNNVDEFQFGEVFNQYSSWKVEPSCIHSKLLDQVCSFFKDYITKGRIWSDVNWCWV